jgi:hypothetical protein
VRSTQVALSGSDLAKPRAENDILASFFFFSHLVFLLSKY